MFDRVLNTPLVGAPLSNPKASTGNPCRYMDRLKTFSVGSGQEKIS